MPDAAPLILPPVVAIQDDGLIHPVKRKRNSRGISPAVGVGAILLMSDGSQCQVVGFDRNGRPICLPLDD